MHHSITLALGPVLDEAMDWSMQDLGKVGPAQLLPDCFALTLAQIHSWVLLSGDSALSRLATDKDVECHGVLWLLDKMCDAAVVSARELYDGLTALSQHPRCRLPKSEIRRRLISYADRLR